MPSILLIDDEAGVLQILGNRLKRRGYEVYSASSADMAVEQALDLLPDLLILDMNLSGVSGVKVMERLKASLFEPPIIFVSGFSRQDLEDVPVDSGNKRFIEKPLDFNRLLNAIKDLLKGNGETKPGKAFK